MTVEACTPRRFPWWLLAIEALAAFGSMATISNLVTRLLNQVAMPAFLQATAPSLADAISFTPILLVLTVVAATLWARSPVSGWLSATAGLAIVAALHLDWADLPVTAGFYLLAVGVGLAVGGVLVVIGRSAGTRQAVVIAGLVIGMLWWTLPYGWISSAMFHAGWRELSPVAVLAAVAMVLTAVPAVLVWRRDGSSQAARDLAQHSWPPLAVTVAAAAVLFVGNMVRQGFAEGIIGRHTERRAGAYEAFTYHTATALAAIVAVVFLWYGYRRARMPSARWMAVSCGLGGVVVAGISAAAVSQAAENLVIVLSIAAVVAGVALAWRFPKLAPWDGLGLIAAAIGLVLVTPQMSTLAPANGLGGLGTGLIMSGGGFALAAAIAGLRPVRAATATAHLGLGLAGMLLTGYALTPVLFTQMYAGPSYGEYPALTLPLFVVGSGLIVLLLFGWQRFIGRMRRHIESEARSETGI